jgi:hypothetical protein
MPTMVGICSHSECFEIFMALSYVVKLGPIVSGDRTYQDNDPYDGTDIEYLLAHGRIAQIGTGEESLVIPVVPIGDFIESLIELPTEPVVDILGMSVNDAREAIASCSDADTLQIWMATDARSPIRKAINDRLTALKEAV